MKSRVLWQSEISDSSHFWRVFSNSLRRPYVRDNCNIIFLSDWIFQTRQLLKIICLTITVYHLQPFSRRCVTPVVLAITAQTHIGPLAQLGEYMYHRKNNEMIHFHPVPYPLGFDLIFLMKSVSPYNEHFCFSNIHAALIWGSLLFSEYVYVLDMCLPCVCSHTSESVLILDLVFRSFLPYLWSYICSHSE